MGEDAIADHANAVLRSLTAKGPEVFFCTEHGVDLLVISRVVFVVRIGFENRTQVQAGHVEIREIRKFLSYAFQISAKEIVVQYAHVLVAPFRHCSPVVSEDFAFFFAALAPGRIEAIHENMVDNAPADPVRNFICPFIYGLLPCRTIVRKTYLAVFRFHLEIVPVETGIKNIEGCGKCCIPVSFRRAVAIIRHIVDGRHIVLVITDDGFHGQRLKLSGNEQAQSDLCA